MREVFTVSSYDVISSGLQSRIILYGIFEIMVSASQTIINCFSTNRSDSQKSVDLF